MIHEGGEVVPSEALLNDRKTIKKNAGRRMKGNEKKLTVTNYFVGGKRVRRLQEKCLKGLSPIKQILRA